MRRSHQEALLKLRQAKKGGESRISQYEVQKSEDLLIEMPEDEYKKIVAERNKNKFIVDDIGLGYDDEGEFDLAQDSEEQSEFEEKEIDSHKNATGSIKKFLKNDIVKKPKITPAMQKEKRDDLKLKMFSMLDDDSLNVEDFFRPSNTLAKSVPVKNNLTVSMNQSEEKLANKYNVPIRQLIKNEVKKEVGKPLDVSGAMENRKRKEPGALPEENFVKKEEPDFYPEIPVESAPVKVAVVPVPAEKVSKIDHSQKNYSVPVQSSLSMSSDASTVVVPIDENYAEPMDLDQNSIETLSLEDNHELPLENNNLYMYWIDAFEDKDLLPGSVLIFGKIYLPKIRQFTGICVIVQELTKSFFVLPHQQYQNDLSVVDAELESYRRAFGIRKWEKSQVSRKYAFEISGVPSEADYIKVRYSSKFPNVGFVKPKTFSHVFGAKTSLVETLLVKRKLKGPCWIKLHNVLPSKKKYSNCRIEVVVPNHRSIEFGVEESNRVPPPLVTLAISLKSFNNSKGESEIFAIGGTLHTNVDQTSSTEDLKQHMAYFSMANSGRAFQKTGVFEVYPNEKELLSGFLQKIKTIDPDIIVGHDLLADLMEKLISRIQITHASPLSIGRIIRNKVPSNKKDENYSGNWQIRCLSAGRLLLDTLLSSKELVKETTYTLSALVKKWFNVEQKEIEFDYWEALQDPKKMVYLADHTKQDSTFVHRIVGYLNVIPLTKQLTNIAGNLWARSLQNQRAERNEMLLIHEFHKYKFILPDKAEKKFEEKAEKKKNQYSGGLVLAPISGLYDKYVILLDFNSLYPSIIREYNICFTTVLRPVENTEEVDNRPGTIDESAGKGILPEIIKELVTRRRATKNAMKGEKNVLKLKQLDIKQQALKLTANSLYGCLGFKHSRFYARPIAALITQLGRNTLENTVRIARENLNLEVIYGDTDSIMINTNLTSAAEAVKKGDELKKIVNKQFKHLEIELDGVFQSMLLLKKKKYAAIKIEGNTTKREVKGLDMVRRDWSGLSKKVSSTVLDLILSNYSKEEIAENIKGFVENFMQNFDSNTLSEFIIYKQLTKDIEKYKDKVNQPHVLVAERLKKKGEINIQKHFIPYIICEGDESNYALRAYHPDEVSSSEGVLRPDKKWYINQQIIPPLQRLIAPIDIIKIDEIVELLGEDPSKYRSNINKENVIYYQGQQIQAKCKNKEHPPYDIFKSENLFNCPLCNPKPICEKYVKNTVNWFMKNKMMAAYSSELVCSEISCKNTIKNNRFVKKCNKYSCTGKMVPITTLREFHLELQNVKDCFEKNEKTKDVVGKVIKVLEKSKFMKIELKDIVPKEKINYQKLF